MRAVLYFFKDIVLLSIERKEECGEELLDDGRSWDRREQIHKEIHSILKPLFKQWGEYLEQDV